MSTLATIVRINLLPDVRPQSIPVDPARPVDDKVVEIAGRGGQVITLSHDYSESFTRQVVQEVKRIVDVMRVEQKNDDGTIIKANFIDQEIAHVIQVKDAFGGRQDWKFEKPKETDNIKLLEENKTKTASDT
jgi:hypothetical protein